MKKIILITTTLLITSSLVFAYDWKSVESGTPTTEITTVQNTMENGFTIFTEDFTDSLGTTSTLQNVWADAYIGNLFPSVIPHLGAGINTGATSIDTAGLETIANEIGLGSYVPDALAVPVINAEAKIGGIFLPFDIGLSVMKVDSSSLFSAVSGKDILGYSLPNFDFISFDYFSVGANTRFRVIEQNILLPNISVGVLYNYTKGNFGVASDDAAINLDYKTQTFGLETQVSKNFIGIITPFIGARLYVVTTDSTWSYNKDVDLGDETLNALKAAGIKTDDQGIKNSGTYTTDLFTDFDTFMDNAETQLFAGVGFNILVIQITPSVTYKPFADQNEQWGATLSTHVKL